MASQLSRSVIGLTGLAVAIPRISPNLARRVRRARTLRSPTDQPVVCIVVARAPVTDFAKAV